MMELCFDKGTLLIKGATRDEADQLPGARWDGRVKHHRAEAYRYREIVLRLRGQNIPYEDHAKAFEPTDFPMREVITPRAYQAAALEAWHKGGGTGVVVLPTGAGKTILAVLAIAKTRRPTLVHVPTIDLMHQWHGVLTDFLDTSVGLMGGGFHQLEPITVTTYDSALIHVDHKGNRFGMVVFDECHRLPSDQYKYAALSNLAPFRLGLTATPERTDGRETLLYDLSGPERYRSNIHDLTGSTLSPYDVFTIEVDMEPDEREAYDEAYALYVGFLRSAGIDFRQPGGWKNFIWRASQSPEGRAAFKAYLTQKRLSLASRAKEGEIWKILVQHREERIIIFTQDNETAYRVGRRFLLPVLTHQTRPKERESFLQKFRAGEYSVLVTSKVLNEGVDVPEASVAVIVSGSGSVREHVQRLGRILRARPGKRAVLYELIAADTREHHINERRKKHHAYQRPGQI